MRNKDHVDRAKLTPARVFKSPMNVVKRTTLSQPRSWSF
jgi:hypothetical protein